MQKIHVDFIGKDPEYKEEKPWFDELCVESSGTKIFGTVLIPGREKGDPVDTRPCAILLHGYPGHTVTFDIGQALRRTGIVSVNFSYRGCWGSEGTYTISGLVEDAIHVAEWIKQDDIAKKYRIDVNNIFLIGHSMGGYTAINAGRKLPWIKGIGVMSPYDLPWFIENHQEEKLNELIDSGLYVLNAKQDMIGDNLKKCVALGYGFSHAQDDLKNRNLLLVGAERDDIAPASEMIEPLWNCLQTYQTDAIQEYIIIDANHPFDDKRLTVSKMFAEWIKRVIESEGS